MAGTVRKARERLSTGGWLANLVVGVVLLLLTPVFNVVMSGPRAAIISCALGLTILVWVIAGAMLLSLPKGDSAEPIPGRNLPETADQQREQSQSTLEQTSAQTSGEVPEPLKNPQVERSGEPRKEDKPMPPDRGDQRTAGDNSPIISGNNNTVMINQGATMRPLIEGLTASVSQIPSPRTDAPFAVEVVVPVQAIVSPVAGDAPIAVEN